MVMVDRWNFCSLLALLDVVDVDDVDDAARRQAVRESETIMLLDSVLASVLASVLVGMG